MLQPSPLTPRPRHAWTPLPANNQAVAVQPQRVLITERGGMFHWYLLDAPASCRKRFGAASSQQRAEQEAASQLGGKQNEKRVVLL